MTKRKCEEDEFKAVKKEENQRSEMWLPPRERSAALKAASLLVNFGDLSRRLEEVTTQRDSLSEQITTREKELRQPVAERFNARCRSKSKMRQSEIDQVFEDVMDDIRVDETELRMFTEIRGKARRRCETLQPEIDRVLEELGKIGHVLITHPDDVQPLIRLRDDHGFRPKVYCQELEVSDDLRSHGFDPIQISYVRSIHEIDMELLNSTPEYNL